jgi:hypothetical protein
MGQLQRPPKQKPVIDRSGQFDRARTVAESLNVVSIYSDVDPGLRTDADVVFGEDFGSQRIVKEWPMEMIEILRAAVKQGASDVHLLIGRPPMTRLNGEMMELAGFDVLTAEESKRVIYSILYDEQKQNFEEKLELDCSFAISGLARFRVNVLLQMNGIECVIRVISSKIPTPDEIKLSPAVLGIGQPCLAVWCS